MKALFKKIHRLVLDKPREETLTLSPLLKYVDASSLFPQKRLTRLGTSYGGWLIPSTPNLSDNSICYSAGAGEDISFDCALVNRFKCNIRIVDPTPKAILHFKNLTSAIGEGQGFPINNNKLDLYDINSVNFSRLKFLPFGLADTDTTLKFFLPKDPSHVSCSTVNLQNTTDYFVAQCYRLKSLMEQQGDTKVDLLKMDIEGAEYSVIRDLIASRLLPNFLLIEFDEAHTPLDNNAGSRISDHIQLLLREGMRCIAVEGSNATFIRV